MRYLGIDPGTTRVGYGVIEKQAHTFIPVEYGCLDVPSTKSQSVRLLSIQKSFEDLLKKYRPEALAMERLFFQKNARTAIEVAQAQGVIMAAAQKNDLPFIFFTPLEVKQAVTGYGKADKRQVQQMVKAILRLDSIPRPDDAADALAIALSLAQTNISLKQNTP